MSDRDEIIGIVLDALADDACSYEAASKAADRIVALGAQGAGDVEMPGSAFWDAGLRAEMEGVALAALASVRREALEEAAQWHDDEADRAMARNHAGSSNGERRHNRTIAELNRAYAVAIRALIEKD